MTRIVGALVIVLAIAGSAAANSPEYLASRTLPTVERIAKQEALAEEARSRGDAAAEAAHHIEACLNAMLLTFDMAAPSCQRAEATAAKIDWLRGRLRSYQAAVVAWTLDWTTTRALSEEAARLGASGPPETELAGDGLRWLRLVRSASDSEQGRYDAVETDLRQFIEIARTAGDAAGQSVGESFLCRFLWRTGQDADALAACERGLAVLRPLDDAAGIAGLLWNRGNVESARGDLRAAVATWREAVKLAVRGGAPFIEVTIRNELAYALAQLGELDEAQHEVDLGRAAVARGVVPPLFGLQLASVAGTIAHARRDYRRAIEEFHTAQASPIDGAAIGAILGEARSQYAVGDLAAAETAYRTAIARIESSRQRVPDSEQRAGYMHKHAAAYAELVRVLWDRRKNDAAADAFAVVESARARALIESLQAAQVSPVAAVARVSATDVQRALPADTLLIVYSSTEDQLLAFAVTHDSLRMTALPTAGTRAALSARIELYRGLLASAEDPSDLTPPGEALYADLVAPLVGAGPLPHVIAIAADGPLHLLPFDALRRSGRYLVEDTTVVMTPSSTFLARPAGAQTAASAVLAVASPPAPPPLPPLSSGRAEASAIQHAISDHALVLDGTNATEARLRASTPESYRVLHFATHAIVDELVPLRSRLVLAPASLPTTSRGALARADDGQLDAGEIYRLRLGAALVVLSGCRTGGGAISASEGPLGLTRAFLYAGARTIVATLWDVGDQDAPVVTSALYHELGTGAPSALALANAKRALIADGAAPRVWAGWIAVGDPRATASLSAAHPPLLTTRRIAALLGVLGLLAIAAALVLPHRR